jgi:hypothetical protein
MLLKKLGLRSLKALEREARSVSITVRDGSIVVTPMVPYDRGGAAGIAEHQRVLTMPNVTESELGATIIAAYEGTKDHAPLPKP